VGIKQLTEFIFGNVNRVPAGVNMEEHFGASLAA
jgi:hypothetical protein